MSLIDAMRKALANSFTMYYMAHAAHWNVRGDDFPQLHDFFGDIYSEVYGAIDSLAEHIRSIGGLAPSNLSDIRSCMTITEMTQGYNGEGMVRMLLNANSRVIESLMAAYEASGKNYGLQNFLADRLDAHAKHNWQLTAYLDGSGE